MFVTNAVPDPEGQGLGVGNAPRFCAPEHASFAGAGPPEHVLAHGPPPHATQDIDADQPGLVALPSEVKLNVKHPVVEVRVGGNVAPV